MGSKTPAVIASDVMSSAAWDWDVYSPNPDQIADLIERGIEADRQQQSAELREVTERERIRDYAFHGDGEPCIRAMTRMDCPENHRYGRTAERAH